MTHYRCPQCQKQTALGAQLSLCCGVKDPTHTRFLARTAIPEPDRLWSQWKNYWKRYLERCDARIEKERSRNDLFRDLVEHKKTLETLFPQIPPSAQEATLGRGDFHVSEGLVFRDWVWGWDQEIQPALLRHQQFRKESEPENVVFVGSGAGRLAFEWAHQYPNDTVHSVDTSPFFCQLQAVLASGSELELVEVPRVAHDFETRGLKRKLQSKSVAKPRIWWASALHLPFADASVDRIVSHWLIDVLGTPLGTVFEEWNRVLKLGGTLQIEGPLSFESTETPQYTPSQIKTLLLDHGLKTQASDIFEVPYLQSPLEADRRAQKVWRAFAIKEQCFQPTKSKHPLIETDLALLKPKLRSLAEKFEAQAELIRSLETRLSWLEWEKHWAQKGVPTQLLPALKRQILDELSR